MTTINHMTQTMVYPSLSHITRTLTHLTPLLPPKSQKRPQILLLCGSPTPYRNDTDREMPFRQESNFFYLTGCEIPASYLLVTFKRDTDLNETRPSVVLFIPRVRESDLMWSVPTPGKEAAFEIFKGQVTSVVYTDQVGSSVETTLKAFPDAIIHTLPRTNKFPAFPEELDIDKKTGGSNGKTTSYNVTDEYLLTALHLSRLIKDPSEIALIRKANQISSRAHEVVMRVLGKGVKGLAAGLTIPTTTTGAKGLTGAALTPEHWYIENEAQAEALFVASCRREGAVHQAYLPICASNVRAATLHYCCNDKEFAWGPLGGSSLSATSLLANGNPLATLPSRPLHPLHPQLLLLDAGCEQTLYASDITRTSPIGNNGKFTPEAAAIYDLVWEMQQKAFGMIRPGVGWVDVHLETHRVLCWGLVRLGILRIPGKGGKTGGRPPLREAESEDSVIIDLGPSSSSPSPPAPSPPPPALDDITEQDIQTLLNTHLTLAFYPHGLGHSLGLDVHDVPSVSRPEPSNAEGAEELRGFNEYLRLTLPLQEGMVVTVEPGCYFHQHLLKPLLHPSSTSPHPYKDYFDVDTIKRFSKIGGVRIEDVVVVTKDGYENLTTVRSDRVWVEGVCSGVM